MGFLDKVKTIGGLEESIKPAAPAAPPGGPPTRKAIIQNRFNYGVNFGGLFVLEKFIFHKFMINGTDNELDGVRTYVAKYGIDTTRADLENHWSSYAQNRDWEWLQSKGVTSIRLPFGYWHVGGGSFTLGTPFSEVASVYSNAWVHVKNIIVKAGEFDIGVLLDLHALPGGANSAEHSGLKLQRAEFWGNSKNEKAAIAALEFIARDVAGYDNVVGLQIVNEAEFSNDATNQRMYYAKAIKHIRNIDNTLPIIISDGWWTDQWVRWVNEKESKLNGQSIGVIIDAHIYRCFSDSDKNKAPEKIISDLQGDCLTNLSGSTDIIVGEYSHVLDERSWSKTQGDRGQLVHQYGQALYQNISSRADAGLYFWTFKFQEGDGGEWGFIPQIESGNIPPRLNKANRELTQTDFQSALDGELKTHTNYWDSQNHHENYEHWRYKEGFITGWADAVHFGKFNGSTIGRIGAWKAARRGEHVQQRGNSRFLWEWEQGFDKGIQQAQRYLFS